MDTFICFDLCGRSIGRFVPHSPLLEEVQKRLAGQDFRIKNSVIQAQNVDQVLPMSFSERNRFAFVMHTRLCVINGLFDRS